MFESPPYPAIFEVKVQFPIVEYEFTAAIAPPPPRAVLFAKVELAI